MGILNRIGSNVIVSWNDRTPRERFSIVLGLLMTAFTMFSLGVVTAVLLLGRGI